MACALASLLAMVAVVVLTVKAVRLHRAIQDRLKVLAQAHPGEPAATRSSEHH